MTVSIATRALDSELVARELGNWRTSSRSGPTYQGLADGLRMLIVDGRLPVGSRLPSERSLADALRVSRTTVTAAYTGLRDAGYLYARRGARSTIALPHAPTPAADEAAVTINLAVAALAAPASAVQLKGVPTPLFWRELPKDRCRSLPVSDTDFSSELVVMSSAPFHDDGLLERIQRA